MKKILFAATALVLTACGGNKTNSAVTDADSTQTTEMVATPDSTNTLDVQPDGVAVATEEDWTEEAVATAIRRYYDAVNKTFAAGSTLSPFDLDKNYYTKYWNEVYDKVNDKDSSQPSTEKCFFVDDAHWTCGLEAPVVAEDIKVELTTGDSAEAVFQLKEEASGGSQKVILSLEYEQGQWRIANILERPKDYSDSVLGNMEKYIEQ